MRAVFFSRKQLLLVLSLMLTLNGLYGQATYYWIDGSGNWDDPGHWSEASGGTPGNDIPNDEISVIIDDQSGLRNGDVITIPPGEFAVLNLTVTAGSGFTLAFTGLSGSTVGMNVYGDLRLTSTMSITYASAFSSHNGWKFDGNGSHDILTAGQNLLSVQFLNENGTFHQRDDLEASARIQMFAGVWNTNGFAVRTDGRLLFQDSQGPVSPFTKVLNTDDSDIYAEEWFSRLTYGSLTVNGAHTIHVKIFIGSPQQPNGPPSQYDEIRLLELADGFLVEDNNFDCRGCLIEAIVVEDTGETKFGGPFTINRELTVINQGSSILINGGNGRTPEVTLNGTVVTPTVSGCTGRTIFANVHTDEATFIRNTGTLTISGAIIENVVATGGANFNLSNGLLQGSSTGWNLINNPTPIDYVWIGNAGVAADWDDPANWSLANGNRADCIPSISDNVFIDEDARGDIRIPSAFTAECNNFIWTNRDNLQLILDGTSTQTSTLTVAGNFYLNNMATITPVDRHVIHFSSSTSTDVETSGVMLPDLTFSGALAQWNLLDELTCDLIRYESGTLNTQSRNLETDEWISIGQGPKVLTLGSSLIKINGAFSLAPLANSNVTVNAGSSLIECERLTSFLDLELYDLRLTNATPQTLDVFSSTFNKIILAGAGQVTTRLASGGVSNLTLNELVFAVDGATLAVVPGSTLTFTGGIESMASAGDPGILKSFATGTQVDVIKTAGNFCVVGPVGFQDINAVLSGVLHAPQGVDNGNNSNNFTFGGGSGTGDLYWIGGSGELLVPGNWSEVAGGCPTTKTPEDAPGLFFDNDGLFNDPETITVSSPAIVEDVHFINSSSELIFDITAGLQAANLTVTTGRVDMTGNILEVETETLLESSGVLISDIGVFNTGKLTTPGGIMIVRPGSKFTVRN